MQDSLKAAAKQSPNRLSNEGSQMASERFVIGVDVGTGSARAGIFDLNGGMLASAVEPIGMWKPKPDYVEQSSDDIWRSVCKVTRSCREQAGVPPEAVAGIS